MGPVFSLRLFGNPVIRYMTGPWVKTVAQFFVRLYGTQKRMKKAASIFIEVLLLMAIGGVCRCACCAFGSSCSTSTAARNESFPRAGVYSSELDAANNVRCTIACLKQVGSEQMRLKYVVK